MGPVCVCALRSNPKHGSSGAASGGRPGPRGGSGVCGEGWQPGDSAARLPNEISADGSTNTSRLIKGTLKLQSAPSEREIRAGFCHPKDIVSKFCFSLEGENTGKNLCELYKYYVNI